MDVLDLFDLGTAPVAEHLSAVLLLCFGALTQLSVNIYLSIYFEGGKVVRFRLLGCEG